MLQIHFHLALPSPQLESFLRPPDSSLSSLRTQKSFAALPLCSACSPHRLQYQLSLWLRLQIRFLPFPGPLCFLPLAEETSHHSARLKILSNFCYLWAARYSPQLGIQGQFLLLLRVRRARFSLWKPRLPHRRGFHTTRQGVPPSLSFFFCLLDLRLPGREQKEKK